MKTVTVQVGSVVSGSSGQTNDNRYDVTFVGEKLASRTEYGTGHDGVTIVDSRGVTETLFRAEDGRLIVHIEDWSHWQGEPSTYILRQVMADDLGPMGDFAALGAEAGLGRPMMLDEALGWGGSQRRE
jgi:hypothetical protein